MDYHPQPARGFGQLTLISIVLQAMPLLFKFHSLQEDWGLLAWSVERLFGWRLGAHGTLRSAWLRLRQAPSESIMASGRMVSGFQWTPPPVMAPFRSPVIWSAWC